ncbi:hypothetical protein STENM327S_06975 [Streptomyces tendae]
MLLQLCCSPANCASRSKCPAVSTAKCVMLRYGIEWYSVFLPVMPCLSTRISRRSVNRMVSRISRYGGVDLLALAEQTRCTSLLCLTGVDAVRVAEECHGCPPT